MEVGGWQQSMTQYATGRAISQHRYKWKVCNFSLLSHFLSLFITYINLSEAELSLRNLMNAQNDLLIKSVVTRIHFYWERFNS